MSANNVNAIWRRCAGIGLATGLLILASGHVYASTTLKPECARLATAATLEVMADSSSLRVEMTEHDVRDPMAVDRLGDSGTASETLADIATDELLNDIVIEDRAGRQLVGKEQTQTEPKVSSDASSGLPPTATRLPGIADDQLSRFRRQMFRTDI